MSQLTFDSLIRSWVGAACKDWGYRDVTGHYYERILARLPAGVTEMVARGVSSGIIVPEGRKFVVGKDFFEWFEKSSETMAPLPDWDRFVQAAEFVLISGETEGKGMKVVFCDGPMDLALRKGDELLACWEVTERAPQLATIIEDIRKYEPGVNFAVPDKGNEPLRKAKYIVSQRPRYFIAAAIGSRLEFSVSYPKGKSFLFREDIVPWS